MNNIRIKFNIQWIIHNLARGGKTPKLFIIFFGDRSINTLFITFSELFTVRTQNLGQGMELEQLKSKQLK